MVEYLENCLTNMAVKEFWKSVYICQSYDKKIKCLVFFWDTVYNGYCLNRHSRILVQHALGLLTAWYKMITCRFATTNASRVACFFGRVASYAFSGIPGP